MPKNGTISRKAYNVAMLPCLECVEPHGGNGTKTGKGGASGAQRRRELAKVWANEILRPNLMICTNFKHRKVEKLRLKKWIENPEVATLLGRGTHRES